MGGRFALSTKNGIDSLIEGNRFLNNWDKLSNHYAIQFNVRNQNWRAPWSVVEDIIFTNNLVRHSGDGIFIMGNGDGWPTKTTSRILIRNNFFDDLEAAGEERFLTMQDGARNVTVDHNTVDQSGPILLAIGQSARTYDVRSMRFTFTNNQLPHNRQGVQAAPTGTGQLTLDRYFPGAWF
jgi:hypothetical protein